MEGQRDRGCARERERVSLLRVRSEGEAKRESCLMPRHAEEKRRMTRKTRKSRNQGKRRKRSTWFSLGGGALAGCDGERNPKRPPEFCCGGGAEPVANSAIEGKGARERDMQIALWTGAIAAQR